jgi:hypothetical protein
MNTINQPTIKNEQAVSFLMIKYYSENWLCEVTKMIKHLKSAKDLTFKEDFNLLDD